MLRKALIEYLQNRPQVAQVKNLLPQNRNHYQMKLVKFDEHKQK